MGIQNDREPQWWNGKNPAITKPESEGESRDKSKEMKKKDQNLGKSSRNTSVIELCFTDFK